MESVAVIIVRVGMLLLSSFGLMLGAETVADYYNTPEPGFLNSWTLVFSAYLLTLGFANFRSTESRTKR